VGSLSQIKHVVVVMFENRSFDNMLGWLYPSGEAQPSQFLPGTNGAPFEGLKPELWNPSTRAISVELLRIRSRYPRARQA
jgi:phospholipase C